MTSGDFEFKVYRWKCPAAGMDKDLETALNNHKEQGRTLLQIVSLPEQRGDCLLVYRREVEEE